MRLIRDGDVQAVADFLRERVPDARRVSVAAGVAAVAPILWGHEESRAPDGSTGSGEAPTDYSVLSRQMSS